MHLTLKAAVLAAIPAAVLAQPADLTMTDKGRIVGPFRFPQKEGPALYAAICQGCHMPDAKGTTGAGSYPALASNPRVGAAAYVILRVLNGQGGMPSFNTQLDDRQIAALATYIRTHFGNNYPDRVMPDEVAALRGRLAADLPKAPEAHLASTPATMVREITNARAPVLRIKSGQTVLIDTIAQLRGTEDAVSFYGAHGIPASEVLQDSIVIGKVPRPPGGGHILTGPIYIDGAEPGDLLEVRIIKIAPRSPYGVNTPGPYGAAPNVVPERLIEVIRLDLKRNVALLADHVEVPLAPFLGIMAVAPGPDVGGTVPTGPPGPFGGNMDLRRLVDGATLYLPVFNPGALFYAGDPHAGQGDGEVDGAAIEASMSATLRFIVHKGAGRGIRYPLAEDKDNFYILGMNQDLNLALRSAVEETIAFLGRRAALTPTESYVVASTAVNFTVGEAVDDNLIAYGAVPKKIFKKPIAVVGDGP